MFFPFGSKSDNYFQQCFQKLQNKLFDYRKLIKQKFEGVFFCVRCDCFNSIILCFSFDVKQLLKHNYFLV